jgi:hypothetical protein
MSRLTASILVVGALGLAGVAGAAGAAGTASSRPVCGPAAGRTLAGSRSARVYVVGRRVYGCAAGGGGRRFTLGTSNLCIQSVLVQAVAVAGRLAAFGAESCGVDTGSTVVQVERLTDGRKVFTHSAASAPGPESYTTVSAIVTDRAGDVAWVARTSSIVRHAASTTVSAAKGTTVRQLDAGAGIVPGSLRLTRTTVHWQNGSQKRSGPL